MLFNWVAWCYKSSSLVVIEQAESLQDFVLWVAVQDFVCHHLVMVIRTSDFQPKGAWGEEKASDSPPKETLNINPTKLDAEGEGGGAELDYDFPETLTHACFHLKVPET